MDQRSLKRRSRTEGHFEKQVRVLHGPEILKVASSEAAYEGLDRALERSPLTDALGKLRERPVAQESKELRLEIFFQVDRKPVTISGTKRAGHPCFSRRTRVGGEFLKKRWQAPAREHEQLRQELGQFASSRSERQSRGLRLTKNGGDHVQRRSHATSRQEERQELVHRQRPRGKLRGSPSRRRWERAAELLKESRQKLGKRVRGLLKAVLFARTRCNVKDDFRLRARDFDAHPLARLEGNRRGKRELFAGEEKKQAPRFSANRRREGRPGSERETWRKVYILEHETAAGGKAVTLM